MLVKVSQIWILRNKKIYIRLKKNKSTYKTKKRKKGHKATKNTKIIKKKFKNLLLIGTNRQKNLSKISLKSCC